MNNHLVFTFFLTILHALGVGSHGQHFASINQTFKKVRVITVEEKLAALIMEPFET
jgi:hypothetical protein